MANGTATGPRLRNGDHRARRNSKPRVCSMEGVQVRFDQRRGTMPRTSDKFRDGFRIPGSRNPKKVGRG